MDPAVAPFPPPAKPKKKKKKKKKGKKGKSLAIGIDLGTTYSCVGVFRNGGVEIIANEQGNRVTPSYVAFKNGEKLIGDAAKNQAASNPTNTVFDAKRLIGRGFADPIVQKDMETWPFTVIDAKGKPRIQVEHSGQTRSFAPEEISSMVLQKMKQTAQSFLGEPVSRAVITVPAYFNDGQRQSTKDAGALAGLEVLRIINEPTAAAIAYGMDKKEDDQEKVILVFDLGGGTFDVSVLSIEAGVFEVKATAGDTHLGGEDFDTKLMQHMIKQFKRKNHGLDPSQSKKSLRRLRTACERAKRTLSSSTDATIQIDSLFEGVDLHEKITRARFEDMCADFFRSCMEPVKRALNDSKTPRQRVDEIVLVGGSTRIPKVQQLVKQFFDGKELNNSINPDEAVAHGAAVQAAILTGDTSEATEGLLLIDVAPLSVGLETAGGMMSTLIKRNSSIPAQVKRTYSTDSDNQTEVDIVVYEGERVKVEDNNVLGKLRLEGIPLAPAGVPRIEISFDMDANGILEVKAVEKSTGAETAITIVNDDRLTYSAIQAMLADAEKHKAEDEAFRKTRGLREQLQSEMREYQKQIDDQSLHIGAKDYGIIENALKWLENWIAGNDKDTTEEDYKEQIDMLREMVDPILKELYSGKRLAASHQGGGLKRQKVLLLAEARHDLMITDKQKLLESQLQQQK